MDKQYQLKKLFERLQTDKEIKRMKQILYMKKCISVNKCPILKNHCNSPNILFYDQNGVD